MEYTHLELAAITAIVTTWMWATVMSTLIVTAKGQVTLREDVLKHLGVQPGEKVVVEKLPDGRIELRAKRDGKISDVFGFLKREDGPSMTIEEINDATRRGWSGRR